MTSRDLIADAARSDEWERSMVAERTSLRRVAAAVVTGTDPSAALSIAAEEVAALMGAEQGFVFRFEGDRVIVAGVHGVERSPIGAVHGMLDSGVLPTVFRTRAPARVEGRDRPLGRENSEQYWISPIYRAGIGAPVFVGDRLWGALVAATTREDPFPTGAEGRLAYFAEIAGIAIGNAEANARLAELAMTDPLTGLANHRAFHSALVAEMERAERHGRPLGLAVIDVDHFKSVNDAHGHLVGDRVLIEVARRMALACRRGDIVARVGGEEFAWIIPDADLASSLRVAERAREAIANEQFAGVGAITVSIGVAEAERAQSASALYHLADEALYDAKRAGRNRSHAHGVDAHPLAHDRRDAPVAGSSPLLRTLTRALDEKDPLLGSRCRRVAALAERLALAAGWSSHEARRLGESALVKDIGMIGLPAEVLRDGAARSHHEEEAWRSHVALGASLVAGILAPDQVAWVRAHHELWDGSGFPEGLCGEAIPEGARLLALADAWDALTAPGSDGSRPAPAQAWAQVAVDGGRFSPAATAALAAVLRADGTAGR